MPFTYDNAAARVNAVLAQNAPLDRVPELLARYRDADLRHARTQSHDDLLAVFKLQSEVLEVIGDAFGVQMDEHLAWLSEQMREAV